MIIAIVTGIDLACAGPARAHAVLISSSPLDGAALSTAPIEVRLTFDEPVTLVSGIDQVISADGTRADTGAAQLSADRTTLVLTMRSGVPRGSYSASYRIVSADTHVVSGSITFGVGESPEGAAQLPANHTGALDVASRIFTVAIYLGLVLLLGAVAVTWLLWRVCFRQPRLRAMAWTGWAALLCGTLGELLIQGPRARNTGAAGLVRLDGLADTVDGAFGIDLLARLGLLVLTVPLLVRWHRAPGPDQAAGGWARRSRARRSRALPQCLGVLLVVSTVITGHEAVGGQAALAMASAALHVTAMALWLGGLAVLALVVLPAVRRNHLSAASIQLRRWSMLAYGCVAVLVLTGEYQASRQTDPLPSLWSTDYGLLLLLKVLLVGGACAAALVGHRFGARLVRIPRLPRIPRGPSGSVAAVAVQGLRRAVAVELVVTLAVLAVTSLLVSGAPARATYGPAVSVSTQLDADTLVVVDLDSTRRGPRHITVRAVDAHGRSVAVRSMAGVLSSADIPSLAVRFAADAGAAPSSRWLSDKAVVPVAGMWTLSLTVGINGAEAYLASMHFQVW